MPWNKQPGYEAVTSAEATAIIDSADSRRTDPYNFAGAWPWFFRLLWFTGRRVGEVLALRPSDVGPGVLLFTPEKQHRAVVQRCWAPPETCAGVLEYARQQRTLPNRVIFTMTKQAVHGAVVRHAKLAGIQRHIHPHMFRHGYGKHLGLSLRQEGVTGVVADEIVAKALAHRSTRYVGVYQEPTPEEVAEHVRRAFIGKEGKGV